MTKEASLSASSSPSVHQSDGAHSGWTPRTETSSGSQALAVSGRHTKLTIPSKSEGTSAVIDTTHTCAQTHTHAHRQRAINPAAALGSVWFPLTAAAVGPARGCAGRAQPGGAQGGPSVSPPQRPARARGLGDRPLAPPMGA